MFRKQITGIMPQMIEYIVKFYEMRVSCTQITIYRVIIKSIDDVTDNEVS